MLEAERSGAVTPPNLVDHLNNGRSMEREGDGEILEQSFTQYAVNNKARTLVIFCALVVAGSASFVLASSRKSVIEAGLSVEAAGVAGGPVRGVGAAA